MVALIRDGEEAEQNAYICTRGEGAHGEGVGLPIDRGLYHVPARDLPG